MTNQQNNSKLKNLLISILTLVLTLCLAFTGLIACNDDKDDTNDVEYTYTYETEKYITNASFTKDLNSKSASSYPVTSITGWDKSYHNSAVSSYVDSGAIDLSEESWNKLIEKLKKDNDLINALVRQYKDDILADSATGVTSESDVKQYIVDNFDKYYFTREDALRTGAVDKHVYMFNNYPQNEAYASTQTGTAQRLKSSSKITLEKGKYAKVSVWVKTKNIFEGQGDPDNHGANVTLISTFNGTTVGEYRLSAIKVTDWTEYTIYVKADDNYATTINLALGLGFGSGANTKVKYYTQGSVLFDNVSFEILDDVNGVNFEKQTTFDYSKDGDYYVVANQNSSNYLFDLSMDLPGSFPSGFFNSVDIQSSFPETTDNLFTTSNVTGANGSLTSKDVFPASSITATKTADSFKIELEKASASIKVSSPEFILDANEYKIVSFRIKTDLKKFGSENITIDVYDVDGSISTKRPAIATFDEHSDDDIICNLVIKNNFDVDTRQFYLVIVVGPTNLNTVNYASDLTSGSVTFSDLYVAGGDITDVEADDYDFYSLINASANGITDLYAGFDNAPSDGTESSKNYSISQSPSDLGTIINYPSNPKGYEGVGADHVYISGGESSKINTRSGKGVNGNYAGLVNSEYLNNYKTNLSNVNLEDAFGDIDEDIQPLMIYNTSENGGNSYGFISDKNTIKANAYAKVTLKVKVDGTANAYVYLVDVSKAAKKVMTLNSFASNVENGVYTIGTPSDEALELALMIDANTPTDADGWVSVSFFIATGATEKNFRLEMWNGGRDGAKSSGLVLFDNISISLANGFTESAKWSSSLYEDTASPLYGVNFDDSDSTNDQLYAYKRPLTDTEKQFNDEYPEQEVITLSKYVWAKTSNMVYAVFNTLDPIEVNPYDSIEEEEETNNCTTETDPATFWMSFSTILLSVALVAALIMLILKNVIRKRKANANDAKSHYKVQSRISKSEKKTDNKEEIVEPQDVDESEEKTEDNEDDAYEYGDVQNFGEDETK